MRNKTFLKLRSVCFLFLFFIGCSTKPPLCTGGLCGSKVRPDRAMYVKPELVAKEPMEVPAAGKLTIVDFWEVSCKPCIEAMPKWEDLWQRLDRNTAVMMGISLDNDVDLARKALRDNTVQVTFPMLYDGEARALDAIYNIGAVRPVTVVVDENGIVIFDSRRTSGDAIVAVTDLLISRGALR